MRLETCAVHNVAMRNLFPNKRRRSLERERARLQGELEKVAKRAVVVFHPQTPPHARTLFHDLERWSVWRELRDLCDELDKVHADLE